MKALISPNEQVVVGASACCRVCEVVQDAFTVAEPFFWMNCDPATVADEFYFDPSTNTINAFPAPPKSTTPAYQQDYTKASIGTLPQPSVPGLVMW